MPSPNTALVVAKPVIDGAIDVYRMHKDEQSREREHSHQRTLALLQAGATVAPHVVTAFRDCWSASEETRRVCVAEVEKTARAREKASHWQSRELTKRAAMEAHLKLELRKIDGRERTEERLFAAFMSGHLNSEQYCQLFKHMGVER